MELCLDSDSERKLRYIEYFMHRVNLLRYYKVTPVVVFDGGNVPCKAATEKERNRYFYFYFSVEVSDFESILFLVHDWFHYKIDKLTLSHRDFANFTMKPNTHLVICWFYISVYDVCLIWLF